MHTVQQESLGRKTLPYSLVSRLKIPAISVLALATTVVGCSRLRPQANIALGDNSSSGPMVQLKADDIGRDVHFYINTLSATFSAPGTYIIGDPVVGQRWTINIDPSMTNKEIQLQYLQERFLCVDSARGNNSKFTVVRTVPGEPTQIGMGAFKLVSP